LRTFDQQLADKEQECAQLHTENARLIALLEKHGISHSAELPVPASPVPPARLNLNLRALFRRLFRGRSDVYPVRWVNKDGTRSG